MNSKTAQKKLASLHEQVQNKKDDIGRLMNEAQILADDLDSCFDSMDSAISSITDAKASLEYAFDELAKNH